MNGGKWGGRKTSARITAEKEESARKREDSTTKKDLVGKLKTRKCEGKK